MCNGQEVIETVILKNELTRKMRTSALSLTNARDQNADNNVTSNSAQRYENFTTAEWFRTAKNREVYTRGKVQLNPAIAYSKGLVKMMLYTEVLFIANIYIPMKILFGTKIFMLYWRNYVKSGCAIAGFHCASE